LSDHDQSVKFMAVHRDELISLFAVPSTDRLGMRARLCRMGTELASGALPKRGHPSRPFRAFCFRKSISLSNPAPC
jgi:hypothetical protein